MEVLREVFEGCFVWTVSFLWPFMNDADSKGGAASATGGGRTISEGFPIADLKTGLALVALQVEGFLGCKPTHPECSPSAIPVVDPRCISAL